MIGVALAVLLTPAARSAAPAAPGRDARKALSAAVALYEQADYEAALARFNKASALFPGWKTAAGLRSLCRWTMGDSAGAAEDAEMALKLHPNDAQSRIARGDARLVTRDYQGALEDFQEAADQEPGNAEAHFGIGSVLS